MRKTVLIYKMISALGIAGLLVYFMIKTTSPKIIFVPFLICALAMAGQYAMLLLGKEQMFFSFRDLFAVGFLMFWFGFLIVVDYICIRDGQNSLLVFSLLFWAVGIGAASSRLGNKNRKK